MGAKSSKSEMFNWEIEIMHVRLKTEIMSTSHRVEILLTGSALVSPYHCVKRISKKKSFRGRAGNEISIWTYVYMYNLYTHLQRC